MSRFSKQAELEAAADNNRFIYRNFAGGTPEPGASMAPDADAGKSAAQRSDPFAPLTSQLEPVGDGHEIYVESVGRTDGIAGGLSAWRAAAAASRSGRLFRIPERLTPCVDQRGAAEADPKAARGHTLPHLIADMPSVRPTLST